LRRTPVLVWEALRRGHPVGPFLDPHDPPPFRDSADIQLFLNPHIARTAGLSTEKLTSWHDLGNRPEQTDGPGEDGPLGGPAGTTQAAASGTAAAKVIVRSAGGRVGERSGVTEESRMARTRGGVRR
jgi:hypothetical protein